jgi:hypothetical protein
MLPTASIWPSPFAASASSDDPGRPGGQGVSKASPSGLAMTTV